MFTTILEWFPYAVLIAVVGIVIPSIAIAKQEIAIEGPFGWSSLTFTRRFKTDHWFSKLYRLISGKDKWATEYHLTSNFIWILIYFLSFLYIPIFSKLAGHSDWKAFIGSAALAIACCQQLMWVEDFIWFLIHPYYGPDRHNSKYVPWFTNWKAGLPVGYFWAMLSGVLIAALGSLVSQNVDIIVLWSITFAILLIMVFLIVKPLSKRVRRIQMNEFWWVNVKYVVIKRCPFFIEEKNPYPEAISYALDERIVNDLRSQGSVVELKDALRPPYSQKIE